MEVSFMNSLSERLCSSAEKWVAFPLAGGKCRPLSIGFFLVRPIEREARFLDEKKKSGRCRLKWRPADRYRKDKTGEQTQFFQVITIDGDELTYVAYTVLGEEYDRAVITKDFETGKKQLR